MKKIIGFITLVCLGICLGACSKGFNSESEIKIYTRDTSSGTRDGFFTGIGFSEAKEDNEVLRAGYQQVEANGDMISAITNDEYGIGYISLSSLAEANVKGLTYEGVEPTEENVVSGEYKLTRNFNYCLRAEYADEEVKQIVEAFVAFFHTVEGQATIKDHGGIVDVVSTTSWESIKDDYNVVKTDNKNVTINVGGSTSVKSIVQALLTEFSAKCGEFKYNYNPTGSSDAYRRTNGSEKDSVNALDLAFASREFKSEEAMDAEIKGKMCIDAIVAVVNNENPLTSVTAEQLKNIFAGTYTKWSQVE